MKNILVIGALALSMVGCKMVDAIDSVNATPGKMDEMKGEIKETNHSVHLQTLLVAITEMSKPENQAQLLPVPTEMMPAGKTFAESATRDEFIEFTYKTIKNIEEVNPVKNIDEKGNEVDYTLAEKNQIRRSKMAKLYALFIIAGFAPDNMINEIISNDILGNGRYQEVGLQVLMMRTMFIRDVMLDASLLSKPLTTSGMMNEAVKYLTKLNFILTLPFVKEVSLKINDKELQLLSYEESLADSSSLKATAGMWQKAADRAKDGNQALKTKAWTNDAAENDRRYRQELDLQNQALQALQAGAGNWSEKLTQP